MSDTQLDLGDITMIKTDMVVLSRRLHSKGESGDKQVDRL